MFMYSSETTNGPPLKLLPSIQKHHKNGTKYDMKDRRLHTIKTATNKVSGTLLHDKTFGKPQ